LNKLGAISAMVCPSNHLSVPIYLINLRIDNYGGSPLTDSIRLSQHMKDSFWVLLFLDLGKGFGNHGRRPNVASLVLCMARHAQ
jgi:hypothetical protein